MSSYVGSPSCDEENGMGGRTDQPVLSRQIRALENELHARLFVRDSSGTQLTPAGGSALDDASLLLAGADAARYRSHTDHHVYRRLLN
jgi:DNA-binding transcriptional LysR family regulator